MSDRKPDFDALRFARNAKHAAWVKQMQADGWEITGCGFDPNACYCNCPDGPCEHKWDGEPWESEDGSAWSVTCSRCGTTSMSHSLSRGP